MRGVDYDGLLQHQRGRPERRPFFGISIDHLSLDAAVERVAEATRQPGVHYLVTPNVDHIVRLHERPNLAKIYRRAKLCCNDSRILPPLALLAGFACPDTVPGSEIAKVLIERRDLLPDEVVVVGGDADRIGSLFHGLGVDMRHTNPAFGFYRHFSEIKTLVRWVEANAAPLIFLCVGCPQSEMIAYLLQRRRKCSGMALCVGAALNFITGTEKRAPRLWRSLRLEWLYRLMLDPRRLAHRYLVRGPKILGITLAYRFASHGLNLDLLATGPRVFKKGSS
jgi:exopolysaccharide biosynthesis WecB/TagA/CpsF family protein